MESQYWVIPVPLDHVKVTLDEGKLDPGTGEIICAAVGVAVGGGVFVRVGLTVGVLVRVGVGDGPDAVLVGVGVFVATIGAAPRLRRPLPNWLSMPAAPRSTARLCKKLLIWAGVNPGFACLTSAAAPATWGALAEVPAKLAYTVVLTASGPTRSGLMRASVVGPWEL